LDRPRESAAHRRQRRRHPERVKHYINTRAGGGINTSAVYEVFLPNGFYSTSGGATSCGGPNLRYCAYHGNFSYNTKDVKYGSMPYPSCGGCQWTGWTTAQNFEHFICHETREAVTDPDLNAWYDRQGMENADKCAWTFGAMYQTSNGSKANMKLGGKNYLIQRNWVNAGSGYCALKY